MHLSKHHLLKLLVKDFLHVNFGKFPKVSERVYRIETLCYHWGAILLRVACCF